MSRPLSERFFEKVQKTDNCWIWTAALRKGYGSITKPNAGKTSGKLYAHRVSFEIHIGPIPEGMKVLHRCDNPKCVNPSHLFLGTSKDNSLDMVAKGRVAIQAGEQNGSAKLTAEAVANITTDTRPRKIIAKEYNISITQIGRIKNFTTWLHR